MSMIQMVQRSIGVLAGCAAMMGVAVCPVYAQQPTPVEQGRFAYLNHCAGCHGFDGGGNGPAATGMTPSPTNFKTATVATLSDNAIQQAVLVGKGTSMRGFSTMLSPAEITNLVLFLRTLATPP